MTHPYARDLCKPQLGQSFEVSGVRYDMAGSLGDGAAGLVRKAIRLVDKQVVAVKLLAPDPKYIEESSFDDVARRFKREGERGVGLRHQHLIEIEGYSDNLDGSAFTDGSPVNPLLVMELVTGGKTLDSYIRGLQEDQGDSRHFCVTRARLGLAIQIASAVEDLHDQKLIHRDIKPANVFIRKDTLADSVPFAKVGDFGVMKWGDFQASLSTGILTATNDKGLGTLKYMAPEAAIRPKEVTARADIYSLGITLFELFTAQILASPHHVFEVMNARLTRGTTQSRFFDMGYRIANDDVLLGALLLDMHLRGHRGRPPIDVVRGRLEYEFESRFGVTWDEEVNP